MEQRSGKADYLRSLQPARLSIDLDPVLPARFKEARAVNATDMVTEARPFIESWTALYSQ